MNNNEELRFEPIRSQIIVDVKSVPVKQFDLVKSLKRTCFIGGCALAIVGAKSVKDNIQHNIEVSEAFEGIKEDAREALEKNTNIIKNSKTGEYEAQYDHNDIAKYIENYRIENGEVNNDGLIAAIMNSIEETGYDNMDKIINHIEDENVSTKEEYLHQEGYNSEREYLKSMKEKVYQQQKEDEVRTNYGFIEQETRESRGR